MFSTAKLKTEKERIFSQYGKFLMDNFEFRYGKKSFKNRFKFGICMKVVQIS